MNGPGEQAMTTENTHTTETKTGHTTGPLWDGILNAARSTPLRMPAGGWFREVATSENWRTTTIVQRHRDRAMTTPSPGYCHSHTLCETLQSTAHPAGKHQTGGTLPVFSFPSAAASVPV
jgi:hypothetical protein